MLTARCQADRAGVPETAGSGTATAARGHAAGSTLAFPTTRFRASSVACGGVGASEHQVLRPAYDPDRQDLLVVCPLNKLTLDLRGVSTVRAGIAVRRPVRRRASNRKIISGTYH